MEFISPGALGSAAADHPGSGQRRTIRCTGIRKGDSFTAITGTTAICRCTFSAGSTCCARGCGPANIDGAAGSVEELPRLVQQMRQAWPEVRIIVRGDSGFCREELMAWCEANGVDYVLGLAKNDRLRAEIDGRWTQAPSLYQQTGAAARVFKEFHYQTRKSWIARAARGGQGRASGEGRQPALRGDLAASAGWAAQPCTRSMYCARGEMENRIKEQLICSPTAPARPICAAIKSGCTFLPWLTC